MTVDPAALTLQCPSCGFDLYQQRGGQWTIVNRILKVVDGQVLVGCDRCKGVDIPVPWMRVVAITVANDRPPAGVRASVHVDARRVS